MICMLKAMPKVNYTYSGAKFNLNQLYAEVRKKRGKAKILAFVVVSRIDDQGQDIKARIVFVRDRNRSKQWLALLSTNIDLPEEEIVRIYGKRWDKEFQGRSYDMMFAHTSIVFTRYLFLAMETREDKLPKFYKGLLAISG